MLAQRRSKRTNWEGKLPIRHRNTKLNGSRVAAGRNKLARIAFEKQNKPALPRLKLSFSPRVEIGKKEWKKETDNAITSESN